MREQNGLTLIDVAVALVIIGLLLGGVLKGRDLIRSAEPSGTTSTFSPSSSPTQLTHARKYVDAARSSLV